MITTVLLITIFLNIAIGTIPLAGPVISGVFTGLLAGTRDLAMAIAFWGAIIGGALSELFQIWKYLASLSIKYFWQNSCTLYGTHYQRKSLFPGTLFWSGRYFRCFYRCFFKE